MTDESPPAATSATDGTAVDHSELPSKTIDESQPVEKTEEVHGAPPSAEITPSASHESKAQPVPHDTPHPHFKWHADVMVDGHDVYQGYVRDISMHGLHLYLDHNLQNAKLVKLHIHVPPLLVTSPHRTLEVTGNITANIYDSVEDEFRSSINFIAFTLESDRIYLQSRLADS